MDSDYSLQPDHVASDESPVQKAEKIMQDNCTTFVEQISAPMLPFVTYTHVNNGQSLEIYQADVNHNSLNLKDANIFCNLALGDPIKLNPDQLSNPTDDVQVLVAYQLFRNNSDLVRFHILQTHLNAQFSPGSLISCVPPDSFVFLPLVTGKQPSNLFFQNLKILSDIYFSDCCRQRSLHAHQSSISNRVHQHVAINSTVPSKRKLRQELV